MDNPTLKQIIAKKMHEIRQVQKPFVSCAQFAKKIGVTEYVLLDYETGLKLPSLATLIRIADALDVSIDFLIGRSPGKELNLVDLNYRITSAREHGQIIANLLDGIEGVELFAEVEEDA